VVRERLRARVRDPSEFAERGGEIANICPAPGTLMALREDQRVLLEGLRRLPLDDQVLLGLRYWGRLQTRELAEILGANPSTVRTRLQRAQIRLERLLHELSGSPEAAKSMRGSISEWARDIRARVGS
jgi:RNA polymerase sigma-70 factor (ECF subfamily)